MKWRPIEDAPKDKTAFLAYGLGHGAGVISYHVNERPFPMMAICSWGWYDGEEEIPIGDGTYRKEPRRQFEGWRTEWGFRPTHWIPLPEAPLP